MQTRLVVGAIVLTITALLWSSNMLLPARALLSPIVETVNKSSGMTPTQERAYIEETTHKGAQWCTPDGHGYPSNSKIPYDQRTTTISCLHFYVGGVERITSYAPSQPYNAEIEYQRQRFGRF